MKHLTNDRRPLYQITDPETRELRYREMFYESSRQVRNSEKALARAFFLMRQVRAWIESLTGWENP